MQTKAAPRRLLFWGVAEKPEMLTVPLGSPPVQLTVRPALRFTSVI